MRIAAAVLCVLLSACATETERCHFPSGRPCAVGEVCLGSAGTECNYVACAVGGGEPQLVGTAVACAAAPIEASPGGPFVCDPGALTITVSDGGAFTPPPGPCPLGGLWTIEDGFWGRCVPATQCAALACDPAFGDDGCPSSHRCDAGTCRVAASDAASRS